MYKATANCQIQVNDISEYGEGALKKAIEKIRIKLEKEGLFNNKKDFPMYPKNIGVITSADSHALQDVLSKLKDRYPLSSIMIYPSLVQGSGAAKNIISQLRRCNKDAYVEVVMLIRGGGSLEDLMVFNDEELAREIHKSMIPIVTGIGHQPDVTIADYVADAAMETPTAAAVFITPDKYELIERLIGFDRQIKTNTLAKINKLKDLHLILINKVSAYHPKNIINNLKMKHKEIHKHLNSFIKLIYSENLSRMDILLSRLNQALKILQNTYIIKRADVLQINKQIRKISNELYENKCKKYKGLHQELITSNPSSALKKGYSIIRDSSGIIIKNKSQVQDNQILSAELKDGFIDIKKVTSKK